MEILPRLVLILPVLHKYPEIKIAIDTSKSKGVLPGWVKSVSENSAYQCSRDDISACIVVASLESKCSCKRLLHG